MILARIVLLITLRLRYEIDKLLFERYRQKSFFKICAITVQIILTLTMRQIG